MNNPLETTEIEEETTESEIDEEENVTGEDTLSLQKVKRAYFSPSNLTGGQELVQTLIDANFPVSFNFDMEDPHAFPAETHGMLVSPIKSRVNGKAVTISVLVAAVPTPAAISAQGTDGQSFIEAAVMQALFAKVCNSVRPREGIDSVVVPPLSVIDYITKKRAGDVLTAFSKLAPRFVSFIKSKGIKRMTSILLRDVLSSAANAETYFPQMQQPVWEGILETMISQAEKEDLNTAIFENWLKNRDAAAGVDEVTDLDLDDLDLSL